MTWTKLPDTWNATMFGIHNLSNEAEILHIRVLVQCNQMLSDGFIADHALAPFLIRFEDTDSLVRELIKAGLWRRVRGGYQLDWSDQESAADVRARQEANRQRQRRFRQRGEEMKREREAEQDARRESRNATSTRTVPSRPFPTPKGGIGEGKKRAVAADGVAPGGAPVLARPRTWQDVGPLGFVSGDGCTELGLRWDYDGDQLMHMPDEEFGPMFKQVLQIMDAWVDEMLALGYRSGDDGSSGMGVDQWRTVDLHSGVDLPDNIERNARSVLRRLIG